MDVAVRDRAVAALREHGYAFDVEDGGGSERRHGEPRAVVVVRSAEEVDTPTHDAEEALATAVQEVFNAAGIEAWNLVPPPSAYETTVDADGAAVRRLRDHRDAGEVEPGGA